MESLGWISIYRKSMNHWIWNRKPFDEFHAWLYLLMKASHEATNHEYRGSMYPLERGELHVSIRHLAREWGWNHKKVARYIKALEDDDMIIINTDTPLTKVTICNYDVYQQHGNAKGNAKGAATGNTTGNSTGNTTGYKNNNINNINNKNKKIISRARKDFFSIFLDELDLAELTQYWNGLNLKHLEILDDECFEILFDAFLSRLEFDFPDIPSIDDVSLEEWDVFIDSHIGKIISPTAWACNYIVNGFGKFITPYHRGNNDAGWQADIIYAFKPETIAKVRRATGEC